MELIIHSMTSIEFFFLLVYLEHFIINNFSKMWILTFVIVPLYGIFNLFNHTQITGIQKKKKKRGCFQSSAIVTVLLIRLHTNEWPYFWLLLKLNSSWSGYRVDINFSGSLSELIFPPLEKSAPSFTALCASKYEL